MIAHPGGKEKYMSMPSNFFQKANRIIFVCSSVDRRSFSDIDRWYSEASQSVDMKMIKCILFCNVFPGEPLISLEEAQMKADKLNLELYYFSALEEKELVQKMIEDLSKPKVLVGTQRNSYSVCSLLKYAISMIFGILKKCF